MYSRTKWLLWKSKKISTDLNKETLEQACYKGNNKRNEVETDNVWLIQHETATNIALNSFDNFIKLINTGAIKVKRFAKRNLTQEEQQKAGTDYKQGEENILRPFTELSKDSQKENLEAAIGAANVYIELSQAGVTINEMETNPEMKELIGIAIHTDWLKRNKNHPNEDLKVPYKNLDEWTQQQDLTVYEALLRTVKENKEKYQVPVIKDKKIPNYEQAEKELLGIGQVR